MESGCWQCLWRKRKAKGWEGDGFFVRQCGKAQLLSEDGYVLAKSSALKLLKSPIVIDDTLSIPPYEISPQSAYDGQLPIAESNASKENFPTVSAVKPLSPKPLFKSSNLQHRTRAIDTGSNTSVRRLMKRSKPNQQEDGSRQSTLQSSISKISWCIHGRQIYLDGFLAKQMHPHQIGGVRFMLSALLPPAADVGEIKEDVDADGQTAGCILADEMGLGKTLQAIALIWILHTMFIPSSDDCLSVDAGFSKHEIFMIQLRSNRTELGTGNYQVAYSAAIKTVYSQTAGLCQLTQFLRKFLINAKQTEFQDFIIGERIYPVLIISYDRLRLIYDKLCCVNFDLVVCDEGHRLKSSATIISQMLTQMPCRYRLVLTGTPIQNNLDEFFAAVDFVRPGALGTLAEFRATYHINAAAVKRSVIANTDADNNNESVIIEQLMQVVGHFVLRRRAADIQSRGLPPKVELTLLCKPSRFQRYFYHRIIDWESDQPLVCLNTLTQLSSVPSALLRKDANSPSRLLDHDLDLFMTAYPDQDEIITQPNSGEYSIEPLKTSAKLRVLVELIDGITKTHPKDKIIIASHYTQTLDVIEAVLMDRNRPCNRMDGSTSLEKRSSVIRQLNSALQTEMMAKILLISSKTGGIGTNLVGANRLIMFDLSWNPVHDLQTAARIHRPGQKAACVYIYRLLCTGSVDEWIWARQEQKISVSRLVLHDNDRDNEKDKSADQTLEFADDGKLENNFDGVLAGLADSSCLMHSRSGCKCGGHPSTTPSITGNKDLLLDQPFHIDLSDNEATKQVRWLCENFDLSLAHLSTKLISFVYARKSSAS